jgi:uncharacterized protein YutE (UPF0331/DUF86 family)
VDWPLIEQKLESLRRSIQRVKEKCPDNAAALGNDYDAQDILALNLTRAVQMCVDIGTHIVAGSEYPPPATMGKTFDILFEAGIISASLADRMKKAVGFRNLAVHNYSFHSLLLPREKASLTSHSMTRTSASVKGRFEDIHK